MFYFGEIAALSTAVTWAACGVLFTSVSQRIGTFSMNHHRVLWGSVFLIIAHIIVHGSIVPDVTLEIAGVLFASGILGVVICDAFLFQSYVDIGPRLSMLLFTTNPFMTAIVAWPLLGEKLGYGAWIGIIVTMLGTLFVLNEENKKEERIKSKHYIRGIIFALCAAFFQSIGYVIAKPTMVGANQVDPLSASLIRVVAGVVGFWAMGMLAGRTKQIIKDMKNKKAMFYLLLGVITGPFVGIWLSMYALKYAPAGIAATLISTMPVMVLPMVVIAYKEKLTWKAVVGAIVAVIGVAILFNVR